MLRNRVRPISSIPDASRSHDGRRTRVRVRRLACPPPRRISRTRCTRNPRPTPPRHPITPSTNLLASHGNTRLTSLPWCEHCCAVQLASLGPVLSSFSLIWCCYGACVFPHFWVYCFVNRINDTGVFIDIVYFEQQKKLGVQSEKKIYKI